MEGMNALTGKRLVGIAHLHQRVADILNTPIGSRVMRRDYGSRLPRLVDAPMNRATIMEIQAATADALARWEPELSVESVTVTAANPGSIVLDIAGKYLPDGSSVLINGIEVK